MTNTEVVARYDVVFTGREYLCIPPDAFALARVEPLAPERVADSDPPLAIVERFRALSRVRRQKGRTA